MKLPVAARLSLAASLVLAAVGLASGCSSSSSGCENSQCATGNECIDNGKGEVACRLVCALKDDGSGGQSTCPLNYHCVDGKKPYCAADAVAYAKGPGLWGVSCAPKDGFDNNPACDSNQNFWCYGQSPSDGAAFCTQYDCTTDADCKGGWYCATVNAAPNVLQADRAVGVTRTVCLPRTYCAPCNSDIDCVSFGGAREHCVADSGGTKYCAPECDSDTQCNQEAACKSNDATGDTKVCTPNAGVCIGDGSFCSPCRSDADCTGGGACASSAYSTEHFCTTPSNGGCTLTTSATNGCKLNAQCPTNPISGGKTSCTFTAKQNTCSDPNIGGTPNTAPNVPNNFCFGEVKLDQNYVPGCWTKPR